MFSPCSSPSQVVFLSTNSFHSPLLCTYRGTAVSIQGHLLHQRAHSVSAYYVPSTVFTSSSHISLPTALRGQYHYYPISQMRKLIEVKPSSSWWRWYLDPSVWLKSFHSEPLSYTVSHRTAQVANAERCPIVPRNCLWRERNDCNWPGEMDLQVRDKRDRSLIILNTSGFVC